jgi:hypothetical protein
VEQADLQDVRKINISGNEPITWTDLEVFLDELSLRRAGESSCTLRISNTVQINSLSFDGVDNIEMSIYGPNEQVHNSVTLSKMSWDILHKNLDYIRTSSWG